MSDVFEDDAEVFIDEAIGRESVIVYPDGVTARTVYARVMRKPPELNTQQGKTLEARTQVRLDNNATTGLALSELVLGKTKVRLAPDRAGGTLKTMYVHMPDDGQPWHDSGMLRLIAK